ncbi:hypothetical protein [Neptunomonas marina]|uniref:Uncharacterized protein n=1 Tax=Neptunomonas marina TaxID=1815562 RepID=A0A437QAR9_9GAMM|nr:hypothetical protein [Neptunomonas marina]RVU31616.1 hypothetical protein EOE65_06475 [Neptunomonas marina]
MADQEWDPRFAAVKEWELLQTQVEDYEKHGLYIKLVATALVAIALLTAAGSSILMAAMIALLWLQEGIWKTFQSRLEARLLELEGMIAGDKPVAPCQLHNQWQATRPGLVGLVQEYVKQSLRPTVAYPYVALIAVLALRCWW